MRYTIAVEQQVKKLAEEGRSLEYISTVTGIAKKVIWQWVPALRPHDDIIKQSVKQRYHYMYPDFEAKISTVFSPLVRESISEDEWDNACKVIYDTLFELSVYVFKNVISDPPTFGEVKKLSDAKFCNYLREFWDYDNSPYVAQRKDKLSRKYVNECYNTIRYWSFLRNKLMRDVTKGDIEILHEQLTEKGLSPRRIYFILKVGLKPLEYAYKNGMTLIKTYEYQLPRITRQSMDELTFSKIFNAEWEDNEAYIANLIAYYTKMSVKQISSLTLGDIFSDGGIRKGNEIVKIPRQVVDAILKYASTSPYKDYKPTDFVFYTIDRDKHSTGYKWTSELKKMSSLYE